MRKILSIWCMFLATTLNAQKISNAPVYRNFSTNSYFRLNFDNDFFAHSDDNYTQGLSLEYVHPVFEKNPINHLFPDFNGDSKYGLAIEQVSFTPNVISKKEIQYGFRPFAAALYLKFFKTEILKESKSQLYSSLIAGVIGPAAYGEEGQAYIHELTDNWIPYGWQNQVSNDLLINYEIKHEHQIVRLKNLFYINSDLGLRLGSMYTDISAGFTGVLGLYRFNNSEKSTNRKLQIYLYGNPRLYAVGYDATLQGGLFSNSIYVIDAKDVTRLKGQLDYGLVIKNKSFYLEYTLSLISKEFRSGSTEGWGGIRAGFKI